ncbi:putative nitroreductase [Elasticomyces elasticus]|nr:putative nitroreductase [Elasticomyces elasticus]
MTSSMSFLDAVKNRRTIYTLNKELPIGDDRIEELVKLSVHDSARLVVLLKKEYETFWDFTTEILKAIVPEDQWSHTEQRIKGLRAAYGRIRISCTPPCILFFEDPNPTKELQCKFPTYAHHFPTWSEHTSAMHQYMLWTALEAEGCGCNLQHYHPIVDQKVKGHWNINMEWNLRVQLVFGGVPEGARDKLPEKTNLPLEERMIIHGK